MNKKTSLSLILLSKNDENLISQNLSKTIDFLDNLDFLEKFEIIICDTSDDGTSKFVNEFAKTRKEIKYIPIKKIGIGIAIKIGFDNAKNDIVSLSGIDLPAGLDFVKNSIENIKNYDIVVAARGKTGFEDKRTFRRKILSKSYKSLVNLFFNLHIDDTQSAITFRREKILNFKDKLKDSSPFVQTEFFIYARRNSLKILELPSKYIDVREISTMNLNTLPIILIKKIILKKIELIFKE